MSTRARRRMTPAEYLEAERRAGHKSEYFAGEAFPMVGASRQHNIIVANLIVSLGSLLHDRLCEIYPNDMRVKVEHTGLYTYPDVVVVCGEPQFEDEQVDTLLNPTLVIEVLSSTTEDYDRGRKAEHYRRLDSLQEHVLVAQDEAKVERFRREAEREWLLSEFRGLEARVELHSIDCALALREVYHKVAVME